MSKSRRTYRVPKRIAEGAANALTEARSNGVGMSDISAVTVAQALAADLPVSLDVPHAIGEFFTPGWRYDPDKVDHVGFYGGDAGRLWANRCTTSSNAVTAAGAVESDEDDSDLDEPDEPMTDEEFESLLDYYESLPGGNTNPDYYPGSGVEEPEVSAPEESAGAESVEPYPAEPAGTSVENTQPQLATETETEAVEEAEAVVDTALGLATALDETVEKLSDALVEVAGLGDGADSLAVQSMESLDQVEPLEPESLPNEASMVYAALSDAIQHNAVELSAAAEAARERMTASQLRPTTMELSTEADAAKQRIAASALQRQRNLAMSRMAASRLNLPTQRPEAEPVAEPEAEVAEPPKEQADERSRAHQPRTAQGRFTGVGTPVRDRKGREGYIAGMVGRRAVIQGDDGEVRLMEPEDFEVAHKGRATIRQKPQPVEDPNQMMLDYLAEMQRRMGVTPE